MLLSFMATMAQEESHNKSEIMNSSIEMRFYLNKKPPNKITFPVTPSGGYNYGDCHALYCSVLYSLCVTPLIFSSLWWYWYHFHYLIINHTEFATSWAGHRGMAFGIRICKYEKIFFKFVFCPVYGMAYSGFVHAFKGGQFCVLPTFQAGLADKVLLPLGQVGHGVAHSFGSYKVDK